MPIYHYKVRDQQGEEITGDRDAKDKYELAHAMRAEGLTPIFIREPGASSRKLTINLGKLIPSFLKKVPIDEIMNFTRNTAVMVGAGLSLARALEVMNRQVSNEKLKEAIIKMSDTIKQGKTFADALGEYPKIFPKFFQEMVRAGEKSGKLEESLKLVAIQLKRDYSLRRKVRSAMMYPMIIMIAMVVIGVLMLIYVVPTLVKTFKELNVPLPASTQFIIFISESILQSGIIFFVVMIVVGYGLWRWLKSSMGKKLLDWVFTHAPVIGGINKKFNSARTCRTLSSLISSGVDILEAFTITSSVLQNHYYKNILESAKEKIQKGEAVSRSFLGSDAEKFYPPLVGEMMAVGEETGELSPMLLRLAMFYENEVSAATKDLSTIIEPVLMILIGIVVGFFAISMISPMYNLAGSF